MSEAAMLDNVHMDISEKTFNQVQPRCGCRSEMQMKTRMFLQPCHYFWMLVRTIIIKHNMYIQFARSFSLNLMSAGGQNAPLMGT